MNLYAVEHLVTFLQATQYRNSILYRRLVYHYRLETSFEGGILFNVLSVLVERCRTYAVKLASCKQRLQQISCVHCAICLACAYYGMKLIYEQYYLTFGFLYGLQYRFKSFLKFASVLCACNKRTHIKREYLALL